MKITEIEIENFRSLKNVNIKPKNLLALVGRNNSGKSNVLKALELFFDTPARSIDSFYNHNINDPIKIKITFKYLTNWEKEQFRPWMLNEETLIVEKTFSFEAINIFAIKRSPAIEWLKEENFNANNIQEWWENKEDLVVNGLNFYETFDYSSKKPGVNVWKDKAREFLSNHKDQITWEEVTVENPQGYPNVLKGALPEFIYIPAVRDVSDEAKVAKTNPFGQLIHSVIEEIPDEFKENLSAKLKEIEKNLNRSSENEQRFQAIKNIEDTLNRLMSEHMACDIEISMTMPELKEVFGAVKVYANDGTRTSIEAKGHGMQRSLIFTILRAYADLTHIKKAGDQARERTTIFAIEEPELYLHPQSQRTLMSVLQSIAKGKDQIVLSTQSNLFVDISKFDQICIMRQEKKNGNFESSPTQLTIEEIMEDFRVRNPRIPASEESIRELNWYAFNPMLNEGLFADKVVIVEGPSEQYSLPIYGDILEFNFDRQNISVVHCDGKGTMDRILRIFNGFKIPTYLWFDGDKDKSEQHAKTIGLLKLLGSSILNISDLQTISADNYTVLEYDLEKTMQEEMADFDELCSEAKELLGPTIGKPLKHKFVASKKREQAAKSSISVVPPTISNIINKVKNLSYQGSILKKRPVE